MRPGRLAFSRRGARGRGRARGLRRERRHRRRRRGAPGLRPRAERAGVESNLNSKCLKFSSLVIRYELTSRTGL